MRKQDKRPADSIEKAWVQPGASQFCEGNINDTYKGVLYCWDKRYVPAIIKDVIPKEMANELMAAMLGLELGLPVPKPFLALCEPNIINAKNAPSVGRYHVLFATERKGTPPLAHFWTGRNIPEGLLDRLASWAEIGVAYAFDTWIANVDRNIGNVLFDGGRVWLIDHGHSFTGTPIWTPEDLKPEAPYDNKLALWLCPSMTSKQKAALGSAVERFPNAIRPLDLTRIAKLSHASALLTNHDADAMLKFLMSRSLYVPRIGSEQACVPRRVML